MALAKPTKNADVQEDQMDIEEVSQETETQAVDTTPSQEDTPEVKSESREVAQKASTQVAASSNNFQASMADQGLEGLELGFGSFPILKIINEGRFEDEDENDYGTEFTAVVQSSRIKHLYRQANTQDGDVHYSYDGVNLLGATEDGSTTVDGLKREYTEYGYELEVKDYLEVVVLMDDADSDYDGEMFILSIPPASKAKFSGVMATMQLKGKSVKETPIMFSVGKKRKSKRGNASYFPWAFKIA